MGSCTCARRVRGGPLPTLLMLHQVPNSGQIFEPVIPLLAEDRRVIAADIPGFGMSDPLPDPQPIEGYAEVIGKALRDVVPGPMASPASMTK